MQIAFFNAENGDFALPSKLVVVGSTPIRRFSSTPSKSRMLHRWVGMPHLVTSSCVLARVAVHDIANADETAVDVAVLVGNCQTTLTPSIFSY